MNALNFARVQSTLQTVAGADYWWRFSSMG